MRSRQRSRRVRLSGGYRRGDLGHGVEQSANAMAWIVNPPSRRPSPLSWNTTVLIARFSRHRREPTGYLVTNDDRSVAERFSQPRQL